MEHTLTEHIAIANRQESRVLLQGIIGNFKSIIGTSLMATSFAIILRVNLILYV